MKTIPVAVEPDTLYPDPDPDPADVKNKVDVRANKAKAKLCVVDDGGSLLYAFEPCHMFPWAPFCAATILIFYELY